MNSSVTSISFAQLINHNMEKNMRGFSAWLNTVEEEEFQESFNHDIFHLDMMDMEEEEPLEEPLGEDDFPALSTLPALKDVTNTQMEATEAKDSDTVPTCAVCMDSRIQTVFLPCHHSATCASCAKRLFESDRPECPICRAQLTTAPIVVYF